MARLESSRDYIGAVDHPDTGELIQLNESHPSDVAHTVANAYHFLTVTDDETEGDSPDANPGAAAEEPDYAAMDYAELRQLAADADTDEINGRSSKEEMVAYFESA